MKVKLIGIKEAVTKTRVQEAGDLNSHGDVRISLSIHPSRTFKLTVQHPALKDEHKNTCPCCDKPIKAVRFQIDYESGIASITNDGKPEKLEYLFDRLLQAKNLLTGLDQDGFDAICETD